MLIDNLIFNKFLIYGNIYKASNFFLFIFF